MNLKKLFSYFALSLIILGLINLSTFAQTSLEAQVQGLIQNSVANNAISSVTVRNEAGEIILNINSKILMTPASNQKLLSSAAALDQLGPDFTYRTKIFGKGQLVKGQWQGDLYVVGSGDPSISGVLYNGNKFYVFDELYEQLNKLGITSLDGDLIANDSYFNNDDDLPKGWLWDDLTYYYGAENSALSFNANCVDLEVKTDSETDEKPKLSWFPFNTSFVTFINQQIVGKPKSNYEEFYRRELCTNEIILRSILPKNFTERESLSVHKPSEFFADTFKKYLLKKGFKINGEAFVEHTFRNFETQTNSPNKNDSPEYTLLALHESFPLSKLIARMNKESDNLFAEMLIKTAAAEKYKQAGSTKLGIQLIKDFFLKEGLNPQQMHLVDGSGLSPNNLITTEQMTLLLYKMKLHKYTSDYENSLAIAGIDGSLKGRFGKSPMVNNFKGKTGFISGTRAISGYVKAASGNNYTVSLITNHFNTPVGSIDKLHETILQNIYDTL